MFKFKISIEYSIKNKELLKVKFYYTVKFTLQQEIDCIFKAFIYGIYYNLKDSI